jgi:hypothetical protein
MAAVPIKWKTVTLQEKLNIIQKAEVNLITCVKDVHDIFVQFLGGPL